MIGTLCDVDGNLLHFDIINYKNKKSKYNAVKTIKLEKGEILKKLTTIYCKCSCCGEIHKKVKFQFKINEYCLQYICKKCVGKTSEYRNKIGKCVLSATQNKYGVDNVFQLEHIKEKIEKTILLKYGVKNISQNDNIKKIKYKSIYKKKKITLPDGRIVYLQGYEPQVLKHLCETINAYSYDDFDFDNIPTFKYIDNNGKEHIYFPDLYIPKINKIIEVKSDYIYFLSEEVNELKRNAVFESGYIHQLIFWDDKLKLFTLVL